ncbi:MAG: hypothetical protein DMG65_20080 [Candidatus Angelobacter sp. Gp1-AA117]|nr:MAG: hypothetical protein DMG65_20080 [Candidatus Angelobacter sp. Gp1-AA117]
MDKQTISFRLDSDKVTALDALAEALDRDRTYLLNEAVTAYLEVQEWQIKRIKAAIRQADEGQLVDHKEVQSAGLSTFSETSRMRLAGWSRNFHQWLKCPCEFCGPESFFVRLS